MPCSLRRRQAPPSFAGVAPFRAGHGATTPFDLYAKLTGKTVLRPSGFPRFPLPPRLQIPADTNADFCLHHGELAKNRFECHARRRNLCSSAASGPDQLPRRKFISPSLKPSPGDARCRSVRAHQFHQRRFRKPALGLIIPVCGNAPSSGPPIWPPIP